jgi:hypothetical protein
MTMGVPGGCSTYECVNQDPVKLLAAGMQQQGVHPPTFVDCPLGSTSRSSVCGLSVASAASCPATRGSLPSTRPRLAASTQQHCLFPVLPLLPCAAGRAPPRTPPPTWQLGAEWDAFPVLAAIRGVQQDCGLAHDPALLAAEADRVEAVVEALCARGCVSYSAACSRACESHTDPVG